MNKIELLEQQIEDLKLAHRYIMEFKDRPTDGKTVGMMLGSIIKILETIQLELKEIKENDK